MITLFLSSLVTVKKYREQKIMAAAFIFLVIGDFFLVFLNTFHYSKMSIAPYGITGFFLAYLCLIAAYQKNFKMGRAEILTAIPLVLVFLCINLILHQYLQGFMFIGLVVFGAALFFMTWTAICTLFRQYFTYKAAWIIAISASLMLICDLGIVISTLNYIQTGTVLPWLENIVWAAYIPGWTLLAVLINEDILITR